MDTRASVCKSATARKERNQLTVPGHGGLLLNRTRIRYTDCKLGSLPRNSRRLQAQVSEAGTCELTFKHESGSVHRDRKNPTMPNFGVDRAPHSELLRQKNRVASLGTRDLQTACRG